MFGTRLAHTHTPTHTHIYIYIYVCVCVCLCVSTKMNASEFLENIEELFLVTLGGRLSLTNNIFLL